MASDINNSIDSVNRFLAGKSLYYFSREVERGLGLENVLTNFHLVHIQNSQYTNYFKDTGVKYFCLEDSCEINSINGGSRRLYQDKNVLDYLANNNKQENYVQTFKVSPSFEKLTAQNGLKLLNTTSELNRKYEDKLSQYEILGDQVKFPKTIITNLGELTYLQIVQKLGDKFTLQFARGHTGKGTYIIETEEDFNDASKDNAGRKARFAEFIEGIAYTLNACITKKGVFVGGLSLQITGEKGLTTNPGATVGNDWSRRTNLDKVDDLAKQVSIIAAKMASDGFRGLFGVDFLVKDTGEVFIIEINARQTASIPMYTKLQLITQEVPLSLIHLMEFFGLDINLSPSEYNQRNIMAQPYSQIYIRAEQQLEIRHQVDMGLYRLQGDNAAINRYTDEVEKTTIFLDEDRDKALLFQKYATNIGDMDRQGILLLTNIEGRIVNPGDEIARINLNQTAVSENGRVYPWIVEALQSIKHHQL